MQYEYGENHQIQQLAMKSILFTSDKHDSLPDVKRTGLDDSYDIVKVVAKHHGKSSK
jgi:hypothetical protein